MLMVSTKSAHLLPDNSLEAFNGFCCTWKLVKFRWKHFREIGYQGELKISKTDVKVWWLDRDQRKLKKTNMVAMIPGCSAMSETLC